MCVTETGAVKSDHTSRLRCSAAGTVPGGSITMNTDRMQIHTVKFLKHYKHTLTKLCD